MAGTMKRITLFSVILTGFCTVLHGTTASGLLFTLSVTFGTVSYHLLMRLLVGSVIDRLLDNHVDHGKKWFRVNAAERRFYEKLRVKKWKGKMGTYDPACFDSRIHSWDEIAQAMCQAELVHEVNMVLSFVPIVAAAVFGSVWVFVITSVLAACYDGLFVIMQRYNRPRVLKLMEKHPDRKKDMI